MILLTLGAASAEVKTSLYPLGFFLPFILRVEVRADVNFNCVVTRCYRFDVPFDIVCLLHALNVIQIIDDEKSDKDCTTAIEQLQLCSHL